MGHFENKTFFNQNIDSNMSNPEVSKAYKYFMIYWFLKFISTVAM